jgi:hypothetical protein
MDLDQDKLTTEDLVKHGLSDAEARKVFVSIQQFFNSTESKTPSEVSTDPHLMLFPRQY